MQRLISIKEGKKNRGRSIWSTRSNNWKNMVSKRDDIHRCRNCGEASERAHDIDGQPGGDIRFRPVLDQDSDNEFPAKHTWNWHNRSATPVRRLRLERFLQDTCPPEFPRLVRPPGEASFPILQPGLGSRLSRCRGRDHHRGRATHEHHVGRRLREDRAFVDRVVEQRPRQRSTLGTGLDAARALLDHQHEQRGVQLQESRLSKRKSSLRRRHRRHLCDEKQGHPLERPGHTRFIDISLVGELRVNF